ncbi:MAG: hypothetical protein JO112_16440 [Planctomycetes bacterium]|nr:hypothetical protein [Planctomycetota bacterium]
MARCFPSGTFLRKPGQRVRWVLFVVVLIEGSLFAQQHLAPGRLLARPDSGPTRAGEGRIIRGDGLGYYAWLRSLLVDHDWSFANEFDDHNPLGDRVPTPGTLTATGRRPNPYSLGPAVVWSVMIVPGHLVFRQLQGEGWPWSADGYSLPYQLLVGVTTLLAAFGGLFFLNGICRHYARPTRAALAAALLTLGSTIVYYSSIEVSMAHGVATVAVAGLVWYWQRSFGSARPGRWLLVGLLLGVAALMRWQLATLAVLPLGEAVGAGYGSWKAGPRRSCWKPLARLGLTVLGAVLAFTPQMAAWHQVYGRWLVAPMPLCHYWLRPDLWQVLGSQDRSLFYWTPLTLFALGGYFWAGRRHFSSGPVRLLLAAFAVQVYVLASIRGTGVILGDAYGFRQLTETVVLLAPGLALGLERARPRAYPILGALGCLLVWWNLQLMSQYQHFLLPRAGGAGPECFLRNLLYLAHRHPLALLAQMAGAVALGISLVKGRPKQDVHTPRL